LRSLFGAADVRRRRGEGRLDVPRPVTVAGEGWCVEDKDVARTGPGGARAEAGVDRPVAFERSEPREAGAEDGSD
jgi:hypothetical protein